LVGLAYLALACRPQLATHALLALLAALPLASAAAIYYTIGNFPPGHLLLISAALAIGAALLPAKQTEAGQVVR
jgi:hypothetical protein